jgi:hypothetical protein
VRRGKHYYEVKSTLGDGGQVELGETQVRAAQENARNANWRLLVVTNVLNENRRIRMLRNPFHPASRGQYEFVGQGLRLRYVIQLARERDPAETSVAVGDAAEVQLITRVGP